MNTDPQPSRNERVLDYARPSRPKRGVFAYMRSLLLGIWTIGLGCLIILGGIIGLLASDLVMGTVLVAVGAIMFLIGKRSCSDAIREKRADADRERN